MAATADVREHAGSWIKQPRRVFHWHDWGGDSVVFELLSGHTYQFAPVSAAVMACFESGGHSLAELASVIGGDLGLEADDAELRAALALSVRQFLQIGWIEPIEPA